MFCIVMYRNAITYQEETDLDVRRKELSEIEPSSVGGHLLQLYVQGSQRK
jgi:hypothetical protein